jgi:hypothetical protein
MRRNLAAASVVLLLCGISGCSTSRADHPVEIWSGFSGFSGYGRFTLVAQPNRIPTSLTNYRTTTNTWYVNDDHTLAAYDPVSGSRRWSVPLVAPAAWITDHPNVEATDDALYVTWQTGSVSAERDHVDTLDPASGSILRSMDLAPGDGVAYLSGHILIIDGKWNNRNAVLGYQYDTGQLAWTIPGALAYYQADGQSYTQIMDDRSGKQTVRFDPATGTVLWRAVLPVPAESLDQQLLASASGYEAVYATDDVTYLTSGNRLFAYDSQTGQPLWNDSIDALSAIHDIFPLADNRIGIVCDDHSRHIAIAVFDTAQRRIVDIQAGQSETGQHQVVRIDGTTYGILLPDEGPAKVVGSDGLLATAKQDISSTADLVGDHLVAKDDYYNVLHSYAIPSLDLDKSVELGSGTVAATMNDAVIVSSQGSATVYR